MLEPVGPGERFAVGVVRGLDTDDPGKRCPDLGASPTSPEKAVGLATLGGSALSELNTKGRQSA